MSLEVTYVVDAVHNVFVPRHRDVGDRRGLPELLVRPQGSGRFVIIDS
jgi:hypothetical protein